MFDMTMAGLRKASFAGLQCIIFGKSRTDAQFLMRRWTLSLMNDKN
jgi:hypothetical protein